jgi:hypothetical protein
MFPGTILAFLGTSDLFLETGIVETGFVIVVETGFGKNELLASYLTDEMSDLYT